MLGMWPIGPWKAVSWSKHWAKRLSCICYSTALCVNTPMQLMRQGVVASVVPMDILCCFCTGPMFVGGACFLLCLSCF